jgi:hypothetical protein
MKKFLFATLAVLTLTVGAAVFATPANAYSFALPNQNEGGNN